MSELWGRRVLESEFKGTIPDSVTKLPTMKDLNQHMIQCLRCGEQLEKAQFYLPKGGYYCHACIQLGRVDSNQQFLHVPEPSLKKRQVLFDWQGQLTAGQAKISAELKTAVLKQQNKMIWAVTGAGKTEMLFATLHQNLSKGARIAIASPRVDVCLELYPRIQKVFPEESIALLHGKSETVYRYTKLVICTVHQLLRFYQAFDVLIVDEVDSFPFVNNQNLYYGVEQALKLESTLIYLTATPTKELQQKLKRKELSASILPARFHRRILPVPKELWLSNWRRLAQKKPIKKLVGLTRRLLEKNAVLIFCPSIAMIRSLTDILWPFFPKQKVVAVYGEDQNRLEKVVAMREQKIDILVTSTILERGVTFDRVSVIVYGANHRVFSASALVQIAGRVDRRNEYNFGEVWYVHDGQTRELKEALRQIKEMNHLAKEEGLIDVL